MCAIIVSIFPDLVPDINLSVISTNKSLESCIDNRSSNGWNLYCILCDVLSICPEKRLNQMILNPDTVPISILLNLQLNRLIESLEDHFVSFLSYVSPNTLHIPQILYIRIHIASLSPRPTGPDSPTLDVLSSLSVDNCRLSSQLRLQRFLRLRLLRLAECLRRLASADQPVVSREPSFHERGGVQPEGRTDGLSGHAGATETGAGGNAPVGTAYQGDGRARAEGSRQHECDS